MKTTVATPELPQAPVYRNSWEPIPCNISPRGIPEAWAALGFDPADYAHLDAALANQILPISIKFLGKEWKTLWAAICSLGLESQFPAVYREFYVGMKWIMDCGATSLTVLPDMPYSTLQGDRRGSLELVCSGGHVGMRVIGGDGYVRERMRS
jgi:hypothetical protein